MTTREMNTFLPHSYTHIITFTRYIWTLAALPLFWLRCVFSTACCRVNGNIQTASLCLSDRCTLSFPPTLFYTPTISSPLDISTRFAQPSPSLLPSLPLCCSVSFSVSSSVLTPSPSLLLSLSQPFSLVSDSLHLSLSPHPSLLPSLSLPLSGCIIRHETAVILVSW